MGKSSETCPAPTNADKIWTYDQYYTGQRDAERRRSEDGQNNWTGAESLEWYTGRFLRDTMHGEGEYRSRHRGDKGVSVTYEGHFYANHLHGYGTMSYPDGAVFTGLFHKDMRWGPGIESQACLREDVGLWRGTQLVRLAWKPLMPNVAFDLNVGPNGKACVDPHRVILTITFKTIGEVNSAIELLKQSGAEPIFASENWSKLYPKNCTDLASQLCHVDVFEHDYYKSRIPLLEEVASMPEPKENESQNSEDSSQTTGSFYAWNNNEMMRHMMKHSFKHEKQRTKHGLNLKSVLSGPRNKFKRAGKHEIDCRTLLMASYLGRVKNVAQLVNEVGVHPEIADIQGNTALMYASCGDQVDTIHFLAEAGADVNGYNDTCCTPLGVALMRFTCAKRDISASGMVQAMIPPLILPQPLVSPEPQPSEWHMIRDSTVPSPLGSIPRSPSKIPGKGAGSAKKLKPVSSEDNAALKKKTEASAAKAADFTDDDVDDMFSEEKVLYNNINTEFTIRLTDLFSIPNAVSPVPYLFEICDMVKEIDAFKEDEKKIPDKNPKKVISKVIKDTIKPSKEIMWQSSDRDEFGSIDSADKIRLESMTKIMLTILQLLSDGADPGLVRCPQPALLIATVSGCPELVRHLVNYGADVNEVYPQSLYYTSLDVAVSRPLTYENIDLVRVLLESGAKTDHKLRYIDPATADPNIPEISGPTLLHAVLAKKTETEIEEELRRQLLEILLEYNCNPMDQFKGRSSADVAMSKNMTIFEIFIKCPRTDLNATINDANQTVLVKIFSTPFCKTIPTAERLQTITNLLLFGADPLLECENGEQMYKNVFVFAKKTLAEMESMSTKPTVAGDKNGKGKKPEKPKKEEKLVTKSIGKLGADDIGDYKQALDVMTECARILHIRWLQAKLLKELMKVVVKYKHRLWNMIMPEHENKKTCGLWLSCGRALEIWDILKTTKRKVFKEKRVLRHILCIVSFYSKRAKTGFRTRLTAEEKDIIESQVKYILRDHKSGEPSFSDDIPWCARPYVTPELDVNSDDKFNVCFECALPFDEDKLQCACCKLVGFCSFECMKINIERTNCHPCSEFLRYKYFPSPDTSTVADVDVL